MPKLSNTGSGGRSTSRKRVSKGKRPASAHGLGRLLLGILLGCALSLMAAVLYFYVGHPPVAVSDKPALWEHLSETTSVHRRVAAEAKQPPFPASEDAFEAAAHIYREQCTQCHGRPGLEAAVGRQMLPHAQQFFGRDRKLTSAKPIGELFWPVAFGIRRSGMPSYGRTLSNTQIWQLALLLHSADQELPDPVSGLLITPAANPAASVIVPMAQSNRPHARKPGNTQHFAPSERPESQF